MEEEKQATQSIIDQLKEYVETRITLAKYKAIETGTSAAAGIILGVVLAIIGLFLILFASTTLAFYLGELLGSYWQGFGIVSAVYLLIVIILLVAKSSLEKSIINSFIKKIFNK
ncbi:MAG: phage holin family protein [Sphingobacteriaceae bacterium]|nr:MAG: phage holin family protein [Sphingobacteriaceae bacterium]